MIISRVKSFLKSNGPSTLKEIISTLNCDMEVAEAAIEHMIQQGVIEEIQPGSHQCRGCSGSCGGSGSDKFYALKESSVH